MIQRPLIDIHQSLEEWKKNYPLHEIDAAIYHLQHLTEIILEEEVKSNTFYSHLGLVKFHLKEAKKIISRDSEKK